MIPKSNVYNVYVSTNLDLLQGYNQHCIFDDQSILCKLYMLIIHGLY